MGKSQAMIAQVPIVEFLKYSLSHVERRTSRADTKASILAAVVGVLSAFFVFEAREVAGDADADGGVASILS
jgi:hypothetical protein